MYDKERVDYLLMQEKTEDVVEELITLNYGLLYKQLSKFYLLDDPDALSFGYEALYNAIMSYNPDNTSKFSTYATVCIYNKLGSHVRALNTQIVVNTDFCDRADGTSVLDKIESSYTADGDIIDKTGVKAIHETINKCLGEVTNENHKCILMLWIGSDFTMTQTTIASEVGCSQTYVAQVLKKFKSRLKRRLDHA